MATSKLDRLLFAQGGKCFFCNAVLARADASVEHLVPTSQGGADNDKNCVACCKAVNMLMGDASLKEKLRIVLNQRGEFVCPVKHEKAKKVAEPIVTKPTAKPTQNSSDKLAVKILTGPVGQKEQVIVKPVAKKASDLDRVVADLRKRGNARPGTVTKLRNTIKSAIGNGTTDAAADRIIQELKSAKVVTVTGAKVTYTFPS